MRLEIVSTGPYPSCALSNFAPYTFVFDGVECRSLEGLLQAFKFKRVDQQISMCQSVGIIAHKRGKGMSKRWIRVQKLWWNGVEYDRHGVAYQALLDRAYQSVFEQCPDFRQALKDTGDAFLTHLIGSVDPTETILTQAEFCMRLMRLRDQLNS